MDQSYFTTYEISYSEAQALLPLLTHLGLPTTLLDNQSEILYRRAEMRD